MKPEIIIVITPEAYDEYEINIDDILLAINGNVYLKCCNECAEAEKTTLKWKFAYTRSEKEQQSIIIYLPKKETNE